MGNLKADLLPTAVVEFELDIAREVMDPPTIKLTVGPISTDEVQDYAGPGGETKISAVTRRIISSAVVAWDLRLDGQDVPCTDDNKAKYLKHFLGRAVVAINGVPVEKDGEYSILTRSLASKIIEFAGDPGSFLKN